MIYLDHHATTAVDARVLETMLPFFTERFGNAASKQHRFGWDANDAVERARKQVASLIGAGSKDVVFTSGATEANNLAIKSAAEARRADGDHLVTVVTEHKAVLDPLKRLEREGWRVTVLPVRSSGLVDLGELAAAITSRTTLVSVMAANAFRRQSSSHCGSPFFDEIKRTTSSSRPTGMMSCSTSVANPYLYSVLASSSICFVAVLITVSCRLEGLRA